MTIKVYALSDLHIDYKGNFDHLLALDLPQYQDAALIVSGDVTDNIDKLTVMLSHFKSVFAEVFFVPGNHEFWVGNTQYRDSIDKFKAIIQLCLQLGVHTEPYRLNANNSALWVVPLFSWYTKAHEGDDSLYRAKPGDDQTEHIWSDNACCRWESLAPGQRVVDYFLALNEANVSRRYDAPVVSFSHFLPLAELMMPLNYVKAKNFVDPLPQFNFTRVAGSTLLAEQIKAIGSQIHIYGHQHRNRHRQIDGITYISHCLAYPKERASSTWRGDDKPKLIWYDGEVTVEEHF
ncbi:MAG: putative phosphodiesterase [Alteromonadaceae bacterium]|jgi:predicted phosphodiesterase